MFIETTTSPRDEHDKVLELNRILDDPPRGLLSYVSWEAGGDQITVVLVWESPAARGAFSETVMMPLFASGQMDGISARLTHHTPVRVWFHE